MPGAPTVGLACAMLQRLPHAHPALALVLISEQRGCLLVRQGCPPVDRSSGRAMVGAARQGRTSPWLQGWGGEGTPPAAAPPSPASSKQPAWSTHSGSVSVSTCTAALLRLRFST